MNKALLLPLLAMILVALMIGAGLTQILEEYMLYGLSYEVTTIIGDVTSTHTVFVPTNILSLFILTWFFIMAYENYKFKKSQHIKDNGIKHE